MLLCAGPLLGSRFGTVVSIETYELYLPRWKHTTRVNKIMTNVDERIEG